jgi:hypothetical protein
MKWSKEAIIAEAKFFHSIKEWKAHSPAYETAIKNGWAKDATAHMSRPVVHNKTWTIDKVLTSARKFSSFKEWINKDLASYNAASRLQCLKEASKHLTSHRKFWHDVSDEELIKIAQMFDRVYEWQRSSFRRTYQIARLRGILDKCCLHMKYGGNYSKGEMQVRELVKSYYPLACKKVFNRKHGAAPGNCFELDVYIPSLRKGIEFNGAKWHTVEGLSRGRKNWPRELIENYHDVKLKFFTHRNIEILNIADQDWVYNNVDCIKQICKFIGVSNER